MNKQKPGWGDKIHDWLLEDYDLRQEREDGLKELVGSLLHQQKEEMLEKIEKLRKEHGEFCSRDHNYHTVLDQIKSIIEGENGK